ncbi:glycoside hydrolase family 97 N-terminal domain-containing protein [Lunatibacter salilacus]|uniref:glycoside hydrolase family 97 N-terminal domain-containing protein n=1 Tax=Lunatibacter salilacus TaxID=2483804 RepID=UPI00131D911E|nr:glycoside hydrolase family 97 N-terminal domain-containing protein [Lunatibacter salilacus]
MLVDVLIVSRNIFVLIFAFLIGHLNVFAGNNDNFENTYTVESPSGNLNLNLMVIQETLQLEVRLGETVDLKPSPLIMKIDGSVINNDVSLGDIERFTLNAIFISRGIQSTGTNQYNGALIEIKSINKSYSYTLEARVFDDGIAFRFKIPGEGLRNPEESTTFQFTTGSKVWYHDLYWHYEGIYEEKLIQDIGKGEWAAPPLTLKLPDDAGYVSLSESGLRNYAGLSFQADGNGGLVSRLGHEAPLGYPFAHDYTIEDASRLTIPAKLEGQITTPWRTYVWKMRLQEAETPFPFTCCREEDMLYSLPKDSFTKIFK